MRVLHFFKTYYPDTFGGVERTIHAIAKGGLAHGIESEVLSLSRDPVKNSLMFDGHMAHKARLDFEIASTGFSLEAAAKFRALSANADVIHYHFPWPYMDLIHVLHPPKKPSVVTYHSDIVKQKALLSAYKPLMHLFLSRVDKIIATSNNYLESSEVLRRYREKTEVIPIGLDEKFYPRPSSERKIAWSNRFPRPFFLFVGVLRYYKGLHTLVEAAEDVDADIVIVGTGPMEEELRRKARSAGASNIHFLGALTDVDKAALLELCRAFVFPSHLRSEAFGLSLVEAAMFGKPMISCEIGTGTSFVNQADVTGVVVPPENAPALGQAMRRLLDSEFAEACAIAAEQHYRSDLHSALMVERYSKVYSGLALGKTDDAEARLERATSTHLPHSS